MQKFVLVVLFICQGLLGVAQNFEKWDAEAFMKNIGEKGTLFFDIHPVSSKYSKLENEAKKMAVFAVLFIGVKSEQEGVPEFSPFFPNKDVLKTKKDFFKKFFAKNGPYLKYVSLVNSQGQFELVKVRGKGWRMGYSVSVYHTMLREDLKNAGVLSN